MKMTYQASQSILWIIGIGLFTIGIIGLMWYDHIQKVDAFENMLEEMQIEAEKESKYFDSLSCTEQKEYLQTKPFRNGFAQAFIINCAEIRP